MPQRPLTIMSSDLTWALQDERSMATRFPSSGRLPHTRTLLQPGPVRLFPTEETVRGRWLLFLCRRLQLGSDRKALRPLPTILRCGE